MAALTNACMSSGVRLAGLSGESASGAGGSSGTESGTGLELDGRERSSVGGECGPEDDDAGKVGEARGVPALEVAEGAAPAIAVELDSTSPS